MTGAPLAAVVDSSYHETSKYLLQVLHTRYSFMEHLKVSTIHSDIIMLSHNYNNGYILTGVHTGNYKYFMQ